MCSSYTFKVLKHGLYIVYLPQLYEHFAVFMQLTLQQRSVKSTKDIDYTSIYNLKFCFSATI